MFFRNVFNYGIQSASNKLHITIWDNQVLSLFGRKPPFSGDFCAALSFRVCSKRCLGICSRLTAKFVSGGVDVCYIYYMYILYIVVCHSQSKQFNSSFHCSVTVMFPNRPAQRFPASTGAFWNHGVSRYLLMDQESYGQPICWALSGLRWTRADVSGGVRWCPVVDDVWRWLKMFEDVWRPVSETEFSHQVYTNSSPSPCLAASSSPCLSAGLFFLQGNHRWRASGVVKIKTGPKIRVYFSIGLF